MSTDLLTPTTMDEDEVLACPEGVRGKRRSDGSPGLLLTALVPGALFRSKRGLCPACGSPLPIDRETPAVVCPFCGQDAVLERRLRRVEPEVSGAPLRLYADGAAGAARATGADAPWTRSPRFRQAVVGTALCPGCGDSIEFQGNGAAASCRSCGTESAWELRLSTPPPDPSRERPRPRRRGERGGAEDEDAETEQLVHRLVTEADPGVAALLALRLEEWGFANATLARLLPSLLAAMTAAPEGLQKGLAPAVCHLLCSGDPRLRNSALRAAERFVFEPDVPLTLLLELGLGDATSLKLLLDAADLAARRGDLTRAGAALLGVDRLFERNWPQHGVMGEILLYRMLYLDGPVLGYALLIARRQRIGFFFPAETLLAFLDEASVERPALVPELERCFYVGLPHGPDEYAVRRLAWDGLATAAARRAALEHYLLPPEAAPGELYAGHAALLLPLLSDEALGEAAERALERLVSLPREVPAAVHALVAQHGDALPAAMRRAYLRAVPGTPHLSRAALPSWSPPPDDGLGPELTRCRDLWNEAIRLVVAAEGRLRAAWHELCASVEGREEPLFR